MKLINIFLTVMMVVGLKLSEGASTYEIGEVKGFTKLGKWKNSSGILAEYYISDGNETQLAALGHCVSSFGGQLVTPLNKDQHKDLSFALFEAGVYLEYFWTAGEHDGTDWIWLTTGNPIPPHQLIWGSGHHHGENVTGQGLRFMQVAGQVGLCDAEQSTFLLRYICQV